MSAGKRLMHLAVFWLGTGNHSAGWRMDGAFDCNASWDNMLAAARTAERGKFDMFFISDSLTASIEDHPSFQSRFEPTTALAFPPDCTGLQSRHPRVVWHLRDSWSCDEHPCGLVLWSHAADCGDGTRRLQQDNKLLRRIESPVFGAVAGGTRRYQVVVSLNIEARC